MGQGIAWPLIWRVAIQRNYLQILQDIWYNICEIMGFICQKSFFMAYKYKAFMHLRQTDALA